MHLPDRSFARTDMHLPDRSFAFLARTQTIPPLNSAKEAQSAQYDHRTVNVLDMTHRYNQCSRMKLENGFRVDVSAVVLAPGLDINIDKASSN
jgi:hypothetical protein